MTIREAIKTLADKGDQVYSLVGKVSDVDRLQYTCTVTPLNGDASILGVRVSAGATPGFTVWPKENSLVVATFLGQSDAYVAMCSEVEELQVVIEEAQMNIKANGLSLQSGEASFKQGINDLLTVVEKTLKALETFKVITPSGPSTAVSPESLALVLEQKAALVQVENLFKKLLP